MDALRLDLIDRYVAARKRATLAGDAPLGEGWDPADNPYVAALREAAALRARLTPAEEAEAAVRFAAWFRGYLAEEDS